MLKRKWFIGTAAASVAFLPLVLTAQSPSPTGGTVEVGGFGQYTWFDKNAGCPCDRPMDAWGGGGRLGIFLTPSLELEGDGSYARPQRRDVGGTTTYASAAARLNYNAFSTSNTSFLVGAGPVYTMYPNSKQWGGSALAGVRVALGNVLALRGDGVADYMPSTKNLNLGARLGLSLLFGGHRAAPVAAPVTVVPAPTPVPILPAPEPQPTPAPVAVDTSRLTSSIYFDFDKSAIRADAAATLDGKVPFFQANPDLRIRIEGNTDERGSDEYNMSLGQRRAVAAKQYLVGHGISADRIDVTSFGEEHPICQAHDEACWSQNRRDDFRILIGPSGEVRMP